MNINLYETIMIYAIMGFWLIGTVVLFVRGTLDGFDPFRVLVAAVLWPMMSVSKALYNLSLKIARWTGEK